MTHFKFQHCLQYDLVQLISFTNKHNEEREAKTNLNYRNRARITRVELTIKNNNYVIDANAERHRYSITFLLFPKTLFLLFSRTGNRMILERKVLKHL